MHTILFTGHMIDDKNREIPRFPDTKEPGVRKEIYNLLMKLIGNKGGVVKGIAGAAAGGDIIFHEVCMALSMPSEVFLALPIEQFKEASVSFAGLSWEARFDNLVKQLPHRILSSAERSDTQAVWGNANDWMIDEAIQNSGVNVSLVALWDRKQGDGEGGSEHMVGKAAQFGFDTFIINI